MREAFALHFFNKKYWQISDINIWNFNETLTNDVVSFEQPGPGLENSVNPAVNRYLFVIRGGWGSRSREKAPPFICCAKEDTVGLQHPLLQWLLGYGKPLPLHFFYFALLVALWDQKCGSDKKKNNIAIIMLVL